MTSKAKYRWYKCCILTKFLQFCSAVAYSCHMYMVNKMKSTDAKNGTA